MKLALQNVKLCRRRPANLCLQFRGKRAMIAETDEEQGNREVTHSEPETVQVRRRTARTLGLRGRGGRAYACVSRDGFHR